MTTFGGITQPQLLAPQNGGSAGLGPSFSTLPFNIRDTVFNTLNFAGPNIQIRVNHNFSAVNDSNLVPFGGAPQQFGPSFPGLFPLDGAVAYGWSFVEMVDGDVMNQVFRPFGVIGALNTTYAAGYNLPSGQSRSGTVLVQGYLGDLITVIARARWTLNVSRI